MKVGIGDLVAPETTARANQVGTPIRNIFVDPTIFNKHRKFKIDV